MSSVFAGPIAVAYHLVSWLAQVLMPLTGGLATAAAIVVFTIAVRLLLSPLSFLGLRGQARIAALQPRIQELRARYARQPEKLQAELGALYAREGGGLLAGCLPLLLQLPFFSVMYRLFLSGTIGGKPNELLSRTLFGTPLGTHWLSGARPGQRPGPGVRGPVRAAGGYRRADRAGRQVRDRAARAGPVCPGARHYPRGRQGQAAHGPPGRAGRGRPAGPADRGGDQDPALHHAGDRRVRPAGRRAVPADVGGLDAGRANGAAAADRPRGYRRDGGGAGRLCSVRPWAAASLRSRLVSCSRSGRLRAEPRSAWCARATSRTFVSMSRPAPVRNRP